MRNYCLTVWCLVLADGWTICTVYIGMYCMENLGLEYDRMKQLKTKSHEEVKGKQKSMHDQVFDKDK